MKILFRLLSILVIILFSIGCKEKSVVLTQLDNIDSLIQEYPDSALELLQEIDVAELKEGEEKALYGLLKTMAEDKNYLDPKNDSIILYASQYFNEKGDVIKGIKSDYYRGRVLYHREDYPSALISFFKAKDEASKNNEYFWEGMSYRGISDIYLKVSDSSDELYYAKLEYERFKKSGVQPYLNYALADLARAYNNNDKDLETIELSFQIQDSAKLYNDKILNNRALQLRGGVLYWQSKYNEALPIFREIYESGYGENKDSLYYYLVLLKLKKFDEVKDLIQNLSNEESLYKDYVGYQIYKESEKYKESLEALEKFNVKENEIIKNKSKINLAANLNSYYDLEKELNNRKLKNQQYKTWFIIMLLLFICLIIIFIFFVVSRKLKKELKDKLLFMENLDFLIKEAALENNRSREIIKSLFKRQFAVIEESCEILYRNSDSKKAKKQVSEYISKLVDDLSIDGKFYEDIEKQINETYNNLLINIKLDIPDINKIDFAVYLFSVLNFPSDIIAYILKLEKVENVYNRKRHLKDKIKKLGENKSAYYLKYI